MKQILSDVSYLSAAFFFKKIVLFVLSILIIRQLSIEVYGKYTFFLSSLGIYAFFIALTSKDYLIRKLSVDIKQTGNVIKNNLFFRTLLSVVCYILLVILANTFVHDLLTKKITYVLGLIVFVGYDGMFTSIFRANKCIKYESLMNSLRFFLIFIISALFIYLGKGILGLIVAAVIAQAIIFIVSITTIYKKFEIAPGKISFRYTLNLFKSSIPFLLNQLFSLLLISLSMIMLFVMKGPTYSGLYNLFDNFTKTGLIFSSFLIYSVYPTFSRLFAKSKEELKTRYNNSLILLILMELFLALALLFLGKPVLLLLYGKKVTSLYLIKWFIIINAFFMLNEFNTYYLLALRKTRLQLMFVVVPTVALFFLNLFFIPLYGVLGAVVSAFTVYFVCTVAKQVYVINYNSKI